MTYKATNLDITLEIIDEALGGSGYDWDDFAVLRGSDGLLYTATASGCSCNYFGDSGLEVELAESWQVAADRARAWGGSDDDYYGSKSEAPSLIERLMKSSPAAKA